VPLPAARAAYAPLSRAGYNVFRRKLVRARQRRAAGRVAIKPLAAYKPLSTQALLHLSTPTQFYKHRGEEMEFSQMQQVRPRRARAALLARADCGARAACSPRTCVSASAPRSSFQVRPSIPNLQRQRR